MLRERRVVWEGAITRELAVLAWPICVSMLSQSLMTVTDTVFVGRLGAPALAGVGLAGVVAFGLLVFGQGLLRAVKVLVSQAAGAGRAEDHDELVLAGLLLAVALGLVAVALGQLLAEVVPRLANSPAAGLAAAIYLEVRMLAAPLVLCTCAVREGRYGLGDTRAPMVATVVANLSNIVLDYLLIVVFDQGVLGAAWATAVAGAVELGLLVALVRLPGLSSLGGAIGRVAAICRLGWATGIQFLVEVGAFIVLTLVVAALSEHDMAAHQVALNAVHFGFLPLLAVSESGSVLAGQAVGAGRYDLVPRVARRALVVAGSYALVCTAVLAVLAAEIAEVFTSDVRVVALSAAVLHVAAVFQLADAANAVARGVLRGTGDVRFAAITAVTVAWLTIPPLSWLFGYYLGLGVVGTWYGITIECFTGAAVLWLRLVRGGWRYWAERCRQGLA